MTIIDAKQITVITVINNHNNELRTVNSQFKTLAEYEEKDVAITTLFVTATATAPPGNMLIRSGTEKFYLILYILV